jgi:hypothetical protein
MAKNPIKFHAVQPTLGSRSRPIRQFGGNVTVLIPNEKVAARWNGALEARLRHEPLEAFLRARGRKWSTSGDGRVTENLASATIYIVAEALDVWTRERQCALSGTQYPLVGQIACAVSSSLALLIQEPTQWRTSALVATARLLERHIGLSAAAHMAAAAARNFGSAVSGGFLPPDMLQIVQVVRRAVGSNTEADASEALQLILQRLSSVPARSLPSTGTALRAVPAAARPIVNNG